MLPAFPEVVDNTIRSTFVACPRKFYWSNLRNLHKDETSISLHFGGCFASGLEVARKAFYLDERSVAYALQAGVTKIISAWGDVETDEREKKTLPAAVDALTSYFERWPLGEDALVPYRAPTGEPFIETSFSFPLAGTRHPVTGNPIVYAGRFDMVGQIGGTTFICDEKTSYSLGAQWRNNWRMRAQLTGYCAAMQRYNIPVNDCIIRGVGILKGDITFEEVYEHRPQWMIDAWEKQVVVDINNAIMAWHEMQFLDGITLPEYTAWYQNLDNSCSSFGGCLYLPLCESNTPEKWIGDYTLRVWDPLQAKD